MNPSRKLSTGTGQVQLAREVGPAGRVVAVEAEPHNARLAQVNRDLNEADQLEIVHAAVAGHDGSVMFAEGLNGQVDDSTNIGNVEVPAVTIDTLCARYGVPDIVVLDIEGYEGLALRAANQARGAAFAIEVHVEQLVDASASEIVKRFVHHRRWIVDAEEARPFTGETPDRRFFLVAAL